MLSSRGYRIGFRGLLSSSPWNYLSFPCSAHSIAPIVSTVKRWVLIFYYTIIKKLLTHESVPVTIIWWQAPLSLIRLNELVMDGFCSLICVLLINENAYLYLWGGDHLDIDAGIIESFEHLCCNACVGYHACAYYADLCNITVNIDLIADKTGLSVVLHYLDSIVNLVLVNSKAYILCAVTSDGLKDDINIDTMMCKIF